MSKIWNWKFATKGAVAVLPGMFVLILPIELWGAWTVPHEYPFDAQGPAVAMWTYSSQFNYLVTHTIMWFASVLALWALFANSQSGRLRLLCAVPFLLVWGLVAYDGSRLIH